LVGTAARTAVVVGTASAVSNKGAQKAAAQADNAARAQAYDEMQRQAQIDAAVQQAVGAQTAAAAPPPPPPAPAPAAAGPSMLDQLKELAALKDAGVLDDAEFAAAKAKLLS
jgi:sugar phosphate isomerase/epimerase